MHFYLLNCSHAKRRGRPPLATRRLSFVHLVFLLSTALFPLSFLINPSRCCSFPVSSRNVSRILPVVFDFSHPDPKTTLIYSLPWQFEVQHSFLDSVQSRRTTRPFGTCRKFYDVALLDTGLVISWTYDQGQS